MILPLFSQILARESCSSSGSFAFDTSDMVKASIHYMDPLAGNDTDFWNYVLNE